MLAPARGATIWLTGLSGSGKSTVAEALVPALRAGGRTPILLDGDHVRTGLNADLGFSAEDRAENVRRVGEVALLCASQGIVAIAPLISPYRAGRDAVRVRHEAAGVTFVEVHVATPLEVCEQRDVKGHYARARRGELPVFTGVSDPYEPPERPELTLDTLSADAEGCAASVLAVLEALIQRNATVPRL